MLADLVERVPPAADRRRSPLAEVRSAARRPAAGPAEPGQLPHRAPDGLHARADALGAAPRRVPARARRRLVPAPRRPTATTSSSVTRRRRPRRPQRGPPAAPRRPARRRRPPRRHVQRARRAHQRRASRRRSRSASCSTSSTPPRARADRSGPRSGRRRAPAAAVRRPQLRARRARAGDSPWSFDAGARRRGASPTRSGRAVEPPFLAAPLPPLDDVARRARRPRALRPAPDEGVPPPAPRRQPRARTTTSSTTPSRSSSTAWQQWAVGDRLSARLAGTDPRRLLAAERARGGLPPAALGEPCSTRSGRSSRPSPPRPTPSSTPPARSRRSTSTSTSARTASLVGTVAGVVGDVVRVVTYSRRRSQAPAGGVGPAARAHRRRTRSGAFGAVTIGRRRQAASASPRIAPLDAGVAIEHLGVLVDLYGRGMREPLPLYCNTSDVYAAAPPAGAAPRPRGVGDAERGLRPGGPRPRATCSCLGDECRSTDLELAVTGGRRDGPGWATDVPTPVRPLRPAPVGRPARDRGAQRAVSAADRRSTCAVRCRRASRCSRPAPAPARRSRSPPSPPATSPRARRSSACCS